MKMLMCLLWSAVNVAATVCGKPLIQDCKWLWWSWTLLPDFRGGCLTGMTTTPMIPLWQIRCLCNVTCYTLNFKWIRHEVLRICVRFFFFFWQSLEAAHLCLCLFLLEHMKTSNKNDISKLFVLKEHVFKHSDVHMDRSITQHTLIL